jgi:hypothetical protein
MSAYKRQLQEIASEYIAEHGSASAREMARWALARGLWRAQPDLAERRLAEDMADAMRVEHITDSQGRRVRAKHVARLKRNGKSEMCWADIRHAPRKHMEISLMARRDMIFGDCRQLKNDVDSYNENANPEEPIQISFNFTNDLAEDEAAKRTMRGAA